MSELLEKMFDTLGDAQVVFDESLFTESELNLLTETGIIEMEQTR